MSSKKAKKKASKRAKGKGSAEDARSEDAQAKDTSEALPGQGTEHGEILQRAHDAFTRGDYRSVQELVEQLKGAPEEVMIAGDALRRRVRIDPAQITVLAACLVFFLIIVWKYVL